MIDNCQEGITAGAPKKTRAVGHILLSQCFIATAKYLPGIKVSALTQPIDLLLMSSHQGFVINPLIT